MNSQGELCPYPETKTETSSFFFPLCAFSFLGKFLVLEESRCLGRELRRRYNSIPYFSHFPQVVTSDQKIAEGIRQFQHTLSSLGLFSYLVWCLWKLPSLSFQFNHAFKEWFISTSGSILALLPQDFRRSDLLQEMGDLPVIISFALFLPLRTLI